MTILNMKQGTQEWFQQRCAFVTGSKAADVMGFLKKGGETQARANYKAQIVAEILTGMPDLDGYLSPYMQWGTEQEPFARAAYEMATGLDVDQVGFVVNDRIPRMGGSPDGLVGDDGGIEIKCGKSTTHIRWMLDGIVPEEHEPQMSFYLACTGRKWMDFVSFDPRMPAHLRLFVKRLERDEERIAFIEAAVVQFNAEVDEMIGRLNSIATPVYDQLRESLIQDDCLGISDEEIAWAAGGFKDQLNAKEQ
jgi:putative phage-type endonuclease